MVFKAIVQDEEFFQTFNKMGKQIPYALALAITEVANYSRDAVKSELPNHFTIRNNYTAKGIRVKRAEKRDYPNIHALVGSVDKFMDDHDQGGDRPKKRKAFSFPYSIRRAYKSLVPRRKWPGKLLGEGQRSINRGRPRGSKNGVRQAPKPFILKYGDFVGVFQRTRGKIASKYKYKKHMRQKYRLLWRLYGKRISIPKTEWLSEPVKRTVEDRYRDAVANGMYKAWNSIR